MHGDTLLPTVFWTTGIQHITPTADEHKFLVVTHLRWLCLNWYIMAVPIVSSLINKRCHCHLKIVCHLSVLSVIGTNRNQRMLDLANMVDGVIICSCIQLQQKSQHRRCGQARYHEAEELHLMAFHDDSFSVLQAIYVVPRCNMRL